MREGKKWVGGIPTAAQWVRNLVAVKAWIQSSAWHSGLKDLALLQLQCRFNAWPGNFHLLQVWPVKKKIKNEKIFKQVGRRNIELMEGDMGRKGFGTRTPQKAVLKNWKLRCLR